MNPRRGGCARQEAMDGIVPVLEEGEYLCRTSHKIYAVRLTDRLGPMTLPPTDTEPSKTAFCFRRCGPQQSPSGLLLCKSVESSQRLLDTRPSCQLLETLFYMTVIQDIVVVINSLILLSSISFVRMERIESTSSIMPSENSVRPYRAK